MADSSSPSPWELMDRGTAAGAALFRLYSGDSAGKSAGNRFSQRNSQAHTAKIQEGWTPPPVQGKQAPKAPKPKVAVPRPTGKASSADDSRGWRAGPHIPHRKPGALIQTELKQEEQRQLAAPLLPPKGPLLDDTEKDRLATMMRWRGKPPEVTPEELQASRRAGKGGTAHGAPKSQREQLQELFDDVVREVEERQEYLQGMQACGKLQQGRAKQVQGEIQQRVQEMQRLHAVLAGLGPGDHL